MSLFVPQRRLLSSVSRERRAIAQTTVDHGYETGYVVRMWVPDAYGMSLFFIETPITVLSGDQFQTELDTRNLDPFVEPASLPPFTQAQVIPMTGNTDNIAR